MQRKHPFYKGALCRLGGFLLAGSILSSQGLAADNPGAHEHGHAALQLAIENNRMELIFTSPAYNLAGFEYQARTEEEKQQLANIRQWLETTPLINTESATCALKSATVSLGGETGSHDDHDHHGEETSHRDYEVTQQLSCDKLAPDVQLTSPLPARFPQLEELEIEWVGAGGQGGSLVTPANRTFRVSE
ncbi:ZrgA family zinc uptake protein [Marinobacter halotolerans]|uniref:ZrgA family zinc uptake protein n=1 Tax=Marinobacter halotolerans TaxID=1569211 RepID=UPI00124899E9|nr:DUF2796 domain-containing protein [Marinobacter halotolerans]